MRRLLLALAAGCAGWVLADEDFVRHVDVFTGTSATGHTHPAASCPFGMIQAGPDTGERKWAVVRTRRGTVRARPIFGLRDITTTS